MQREPSIAAQFGRWTSAHAQAARAQGWNMFNYDCLGLLQLQRCDEREIFLSDAEAIAFVRTRAGSGDPTALLAIELDEFFDPIIYPANSASGADHEAVGLPESTPEGPSIQP